MAQGKNEEEEEHALPSKRKPDLTFVEEGIVQASENNPKKHQKLETSSDNNSSVPEVEKIDEVEHNHVEEEEEDGDDEDEEEEDYESEDDEEDDGDDDDDDDEDEHSNEKADVDRKGKGILVEDRGKGKLIEESDDSIGSDGDSDLSDDPLAEVDMDNILPSRTRRRAVQPGVYISDDIRKDFHGDDGNA
ncbi:unnamed protein product [Ilex paraguariensis]|uniref:Uncharacterized protein n=2 Tax=Ilex paraguariensis TaxID=185542 RepID=A0ABC8U235_9AQUA